MLIMLFKFHKKSKNVYMSFKFECFSRNRGGFRFGGLLRSLRDFHQT